MRTAFALLVVAFLIGCNVLGAQNTTTQTPPKPKHYKVEKTDAEWRKLLPANTYEILRHAATEQAFTGKTWNNHAEGIYVCAGCGQELFSSKTKFESGTGWPSFWKPIAKARVEEVADHSLGMDRIEVLCSRCGGHLGHVFDDGPKPTGLRYCMNSGAMVFRPAKPAGK